MTPSDIETLAKACGIVAAELEESGKITGPELARIIQAAAQNPVAGIAILTREAVEREVDLTPIASEMAATLHEIDPSCERNLTDAEQGRFMIVYVKQVNEAKRGMTVQEAAEYIGVSRAGVNAAVNEGRIKGHKVRGRWVLDPQSVEEFRDARQGS